MQMFVGMSFIQVCIFNKRCMPGVVQAVDACHSAAQSTAAGVCILISRVA